MPAAHLTLREEDVVRLTLEFLHNRQLHISQLSVERETGVINGEFSDDVVFLRQLVLDGQWDDVLEFIQPLEAIQAFDMRRFRYAVLRHKYVELLCIKNEAGLATPAPGAVGVDSAVDEVVKVMRELERVAPSKEDYSNLCLLLTLPRLTDHLQYRDWNPSSARVQCFQEIFPLVEKFLPGEKKPPDATPAPSKCAKHDRLLQLIIKGILYESCVKYCQGKATGSQDAHLDEMTFSRLLDGPAGFSDSDLSLLSWLQSIPHDTFAVPFEQRTLNVDVERLERPSLETSWTEHIFVTPIKPKTFPHSAMPLSRPRSAADMMTRSLLPGRVGSALMNLSSTADVMSRSSFASFHLTGHKNNKLMNTSVDRLFESDADVFLSNSYAEYPQLPSIQEMHTPAPTRSKPATQAATTSASLGSTPEHGGHDTAGSTARSSRRDSLSERAAATSSVHHTPSHQSNTPSHVVTSTPALRDADTPGHTTNLFQEYQRQKMRSQESRDNRLHEESRVGSGDFGLMLLPLRPVETATRRRPVSRSVFTTSLPPLRDSFIPVPRVPLPNRRAAPNAVSSTVSTGVTSRVVATPSPPSGRHTSSTSGISVNGTTDSMTSQPSTIPCDSAGVTPSHYDSVKGAATVVGGASPPAPGRPRFVAVTSLEDVQAVRCAEFHPLGRVYAVGSNSKTLRVCAYPRLGELREDHATYQPTVLFKRTRHHKGSIYCMAWSPMGDIMATGSNDKTVKLMRFNADTSNLEGQEIELTMHDGTVRDVCFLEDTSNKSSLLISGGAGDCKIYVTDCATGQPYQALSGHSGHILSLYNWGGAMFVSGSQDKTVRFWDLRTRGCVDMVTPVTTPGSRMGSPVAAVCMDPSGRLLVSGHEDATCVLYDVRGGRTVQAFKPHTADIRSIRFSPSAYYLLTGGYDNKVVLTDLQGDLTMPLPSVVVAQHTDKVISGRWHPTEFSFLSTSADKTATLWALPPV